MACKTFSYAQTRCLAWEGPVVTLLILEEVNLMGAPPVSSAYAIHLYACGDFCTPDNSYFGLHVHPQYLFLQAVLKQDKACVWLRSVHAKLTIQQSIDFPLVSRAHASAAAPTGLVVGCELHMTDWCVQLSERKLYAATKRSVLLMINTAITMNVQSACAYSVEGMQQQYVASFFLSFVSSRNCWQPCVHTHTGRLPRLAALL